MEKSGYHRESIVVSQGSLGLNVGNVGQSLHVRTRVRILTGRPLHPDPYLVLGHFKTCYNIMKFSILKDLFY